MTTATRSNDCRDVLAPRPQPTPAGEAIGDEHHQGRTGAAWTDASAVRSSNGRGPASASDKQRGIGLLLEEPGSSKGRNVVVISVGDRLDQRLLF